ncbi:MAG: uroporphyrinogen decarboxylase family protein [Flexilinea sp.]
MNSRERLITTMDFHEPDHVPFDLGSTQVTGINEFAYRNLRKAYGLPEKEIVYSDQIQGLALPEEDFLQLIGVDTRGLFPLNAHNWNVNVTDGGDYWMYHDEWGITYRKPKANGLYFSIFQEPLKNDKLTSESIKNHSWPDFKDPVRIAGLRELAEKYRSQGFAVVIKDPFAGIFEMAQRICGMDYLLMLMASEPDLAGLLFDKMMELKIDFFSTALPQLGDLVDVIGLMDDYGTQVSQLISPRMFRSQIKPRLQEVFECVKTNAPHAKRFFHSCGNVRPLIPDFLEIGVQILNPVHVRAAGMDPFQLKKDFGDKITFWGGGVDTQGVLPMGTPGEVREDVKRNLEALMPGGGYVFNTIHDIQADVPAENLVAMIETLHEYGVY